MGILNVTPDSFSDGDQYLDPDRAFARALELEEQGADIIDIGAESTRPGSARVSEAEENAPPDAGAQAPARQAERAHLRRYLQGRGGRKRARTRRGDRQRSHRPDVRSADSAHRGSARRRAHPQPYARHAGKLGQVAAAQQCDRGHTERSGGVHPPARLRSRVDRARIVIDPGIGFGKRGEQNSEILARLGELAALGLPLLVGPSNKQFLKQRTQRETQFATAAAVACAILGGAHIVRVHDVAEMRAAANVADAVARLASEEAG